MDIQLDTSKLWGLVAYTDGGARPNPGSAGSGLLGYLYPIDDSIGKPMKFTDGEIIKYAYTSAVGYIYCNKDGEPSPGQKRSGQSVKPEYFLEIAESFSGQYTNNFAEMNSLKNALRLALKHKVSKLHIISDSDYALKVCSQWAERWEVNGWIKQDGEEVKNLELVKALLADYRDVKAMGVEVSMEWIKGHRGHPGNMEADDMATIGVLKSRAGIDDSQVHYYKAKDYIEPKRDRHPLMSLKRMYFNRERERNTPGTYLMADPGKEDHLIGKPIAEAIFSIVKMKEPIALIENVLDAQGRYEQDFNITMMIKMEDLYSPDAYRMINSHGSYALHRDKKRSNVVLPGGRPITVERLPIGITMRAIDSINSLETILDQYQQLASGEIADSDGSNYNSMMIHDLTPLLYTTVEKKVGKEMIVKKQFTNSIVVGQKDFPIELNIDGHPLKIILKLGMDVLDRNSLKRLETSNPTVHVITWKDSSVSFRYASVISCDEGLAIWSNFYADRLFLKKK